MQDHSTAMTAASRPRQQGRPRSILVVDDDPRVCRLLSRYLAREGFEVETAVDGRQMTQTLRERHFDLVILDLNLPGEDDGLSLARRLRANSAVSIIMLTGKSDPVDKVVGLEIGADDYVTKPFERRELLARIRSVLRRSGGAGGQGDPLVVGFDGWRLDLVRQDLTSPLGRRVELTAYEYQLLSHLAQRPGRVLTRDQILDGLSSRVWAPFDRSVDVLVGKLRRKLGDDPRQPSIIKTVRGAGYVFVAPTETS